uniref:Uncharacterized protein n=1 Tax=Oryza nivara TaxID=4536 RepID=A0A0E0J7V5_ORYNI
MRPDAAGSRTDVARCGRALARCRLVPARCTIQMRPDAAGRRRPIPERRRGYRHDEEGRDPAAAAATSPRKGELGDAISGLSNVRGNRIRFLLHHRAVTSKG